MKSHQLKYLLLSTVFLLGAALPSYAQEVPAEQLLLNPDEEEENLSQGQDSPKSSVAKAAEGSQAAVGPRGVAISKETASRTAAKVTSSQPSSASAVRNQSEPLSSKEGQSISRGASQARSASHRTKDYKSPSFAESVQSSASSTPAPIDLGSLANFGTVTVAQMTNAGTALGLTAPQAAGFVADMRDVFAGRITTVRDMAKRLNLLATEASTLGGPAVALANMMTQLDTAGIRVPAGVRAAALQRRADIRAHPQYVTHGGNETARLGIVRLRVANLAGLAAAGRAAWTPEVTHLETVIYPLLGKYIGMLDSGNLPTIAADLRARQAAIQARGGAYNAVVRLHYQHAIDAVNAAIAQHPVYQQIMDDADRQAQARGD